MVLAASALSLKSSAAVVVSDVSRSGAKLQGRDLPDVGTDVLLTVGDAEVFGKIVWLRRDECGIAFDTVLTPQLARQLKRNGRWAKVMGIPTV